MANVKLWFESELRRMLGFDEVSEDTLNKSFREQSQVLWTHVYFLGWYLASGVLQERRMPSERQDI